jgi:transcriptional regulator with XRE-family HTH domain
MPAWVSSPVHRDLIVAMVAARKAAGMTQRDVAAKLGKPPSLVAKVESIERNLSVLEFLAWMKAVGVSPNDLLKHLPDRAEIEI